MPETIANEAIPLMTGSDGVIFIEGTRVPLDTVIAAFEDGATPEEIAQQYPTVSLASIYQVIGYYLRHRKAIDEYLGKRAAQRATVRAMNETRWPAAGIRERLLARQK